MTEKHSGGLSFELTKEQQAAFALIGGKSGVRISGVVQGGKVLIDVVALNNGIVKISDQPFNVPGMAPFIACNGPMPDEV